MVPRAHKLEALGRILDMEAPPAPSSSAARATRWTSSPRRCTARGYRAEALHGGLSQDQRDRVMKQFRDGKADLLIATDVAARGLDIEHSAT